MGPKALGRQSIIPPYLTEDGNREGGLEAHVSSWKVLEIHGLLLAYQD